MVFQDPYSTLNPRLKVGSVLAEAVRVHRMRPREAVAARVTELLELVELPASIAGRYPGHLSGGQRQRVGIARALAVEPELIVADEPVSALDVSVQAQILNLINDLKQELGVSWVFIGHNLATVRQVSDRIAVMYLGRIVEQGPADVILSAPLHPYTKALLEAVPHPDPTLADAAAEAARRPALARAAAARLPLRIALSHRRAVLRRARPVARRRGARARGRVLGGHRRPRRGRPPLLPRRRTRRSAQAL